MDGIDRPAWHSTEQGTVSPQPQVKSTIFPFQASSSVNEVARILTSANGAGPPQPAIESCAIRVDHGKQRGRIFRFK
jgi:hypothetical protein